MREIDSYITIWCLLKRNLVRTGEKVLDAARNYIKYDEIWGDGKVEEKIKYWKKDTAGFKCNDLPISSYCARGTCLKRKFGIGGHFDSQWPSVSGLIRIMYKPDHEYFFNVEVAADKIVQVHAHVVSNNLTK